MRDAKGLYYAAQMLRALELQMKWEKKSSNQELRELGDILTNFAFYVNSLELDKMSLELERMELTKENAYLLSRAIKAEEELDKVKGTEVDFTIEINKRLETKNKISQTLKKPKF